MTRVLDHLPVSSRQTNVRFGDRYVLIKPHQILAWLSVDMPGNVKPAAGTPRIPALLDTGLNADVSIQYRHLQDWAGIHPDQLPFLGNMDINKQMVHRRAAAV